MFIVDDHNKTNLTKSRDKVQARQRVRQSTKRISKVRRRSEKTISKQELNYNINPRKPLS